MYFKRITKVFIFKKLHSSVYLYSFSILCVVLHCNTYVIQCNTVILTYRPQPMIAPQCDAPEPTTSDSRTIRSTKTNEAADNFLLIEKNRGRK